MSGWVWFLDGKGITSCMQHSHLSFSFFFFLHKSCLFFFFLLLSPPPPCHLLLAWVQYTFFCSWWWWPAFCALLRRAGGERTRRLAPLRTQGIEREERFDKFVSKKMDQTPFPISSFSGSKFRFNIDTLTYPLLIFFLSFTTVPQNQKKKRLFLHLQRLFQPPFLFFSPFLSFSFSPFLEAGRAVQKNRPPPPPPPPPTVGCRVEVRSILVFLFNLSLRWYRNQQCGAFQK